MSILYSNDSKMNIFLQLCDISRKVTRYSTVRLSGTLVVHIATSLNLKYAVIIMITASLAAKFQSVFHVKKQMALFGNRMLHIFIAL